MLIFSLIFFFIERSLISRAEDQLSLAPQGANVDRSETCTSKMNIKEPFSKNSTQELSDLKPRDLEGLEWCF